MVVARGKKVLTFDMKKDPPTKAELEKVVLGPTGNLRAPAARTGKTNMKVNNRSPFPPRAPSHRPERLTRYHKIAA